jgi:D-tagatose-1,6-bisphosphate aldolase subunit GatZ/KbaZ
MVRDHFYVLKVGPWLTFALREGLYLLEMIEKELDISMPSCFRDTLIETMRENPGHWEQYYLGTSEEIELKLNFSYSDRARYYLGGELVLASQKRLMQNLSHNMPESLISQFMPKQYSRLRLGELGQEPRSMAVDRISNVLELYMEAGR